jgi:hypothetical protein
MLPGIAAPQAQNDRQREGERVALWAAMSVSQPIFYGREADALQMSFGIFNDRALPVNPRVESSHVLINGVELKDWRFIVTNGPHTSSFSTSYAIDIDCSPPETFASRWKSHEQPLVCGFGNVPRHYPITFTDDVF